MKTDKAKKLDDLRIPADEFDRIMRKALGVVPDTEAVKPKSARRKPKKASAVKPKSAEK
ncbi:MAG: hypothetical protein AB7P22_16270 [Vicinamibacterales bacterium]